MSALAIPLMPAEGRQPRVTRISPYALRPADGYRSDPEAFGAVDVPGIGRGVKVSLASQKEDFEQVFRLLASNYQTRGYEPASGKPLRFTPFHALPETTVFVAKQGRKVVGTLSLVPDNAILGLPMESVYASEIKSLREDGRNLVEVTSLADRELSIRESVPVLVTLIRVMAQFAAGQGAHTWVITVNPRHRPFYERIMGFIPIGPRKAYPAVQNHPADALAVTMPLLAINAPAMYRQLFGETLPPSVLRPASMSADLVRSFAADSTQTDLTTVDEILLKVEQRAARQCCR